MRRFLVGFLCCSLLMFPQCSKKGNSMSCTYDPCNGTAPAAEVQQVEAYLATNKITAVKHCSGMYYRIDTSGNGAQPTACSSVTVKYTGTLTDGTIFDQSLDPISFSLLQLIEGWKKGLPLIKKGGRIKLIIPPSLGYGATQQLTRRATIPPNSIIIFDIELLDVS